MEDRRAEMSVTYTAFGLQDWAATSLGPIASWPPPLRYAYNLCSHTPTPQAILWGEQRLVICNEAWQRLIDKNTKLSAILGRPLEEAWPAFFEALGGAHSLEESKSRPIERKKQRLEAERGGEVCDCYFYVTLSPIMLDDGEIGGLWNTMVDITDEVLQQRRLRVLSDLSLNTGAASSADAASKQMASILQNREDIPFAFFYMRNADGKGANLVASAIDKVVAPHLTMIPSFVDFSEQGQTEWPIADLFFSRESKEIKMEHAIPRVNRVIGLPVITAYDTDTVVAVLILAVNKMHTLDDDYREWFDQISHHLVTAFTNARGRDEALKRAEALAEIDMSKTVFFNNVSHEFRTPLTLMMAPLEDALADLSLPEAHLKTLDLIFKNGQRLMKLVNTLLDFSRIEAGKQVGSFTKVNVAPFTRELAASFDPVAKRLGVAMILDCEEPAEDAEDVYLDKDMWEKIVLNLLSNALKFTWEGSVTCSLRQKESEFVLVVADTGVGIAPEHLAHLFERFYRVDNNKGRSREGTGIGLALVRELVKLHGGTISLESTQGVGSTFTVRIPTGYSHLPLDRIVSSSEAAETERSKRGLVPTSNISNQFTNDTRNWSTVFNADQPKGTELVSDLDLGVEKADMIDSDTSDSSGSESDSSTDGELYPGGNNRPKKRRRKFKVLLADDNGEMRSFMETLLSPYFLFKAVNNGSAALQEIRTEMPDLLLSDVMMPIMDGFALLRALRDDPVTVQLPVILLSARAGFEASVEALEAGADDYVTKPFSARELIAKVRGIANLSRLRKKIVDRERTSTMHKQLVLSVTEKIRAGLFSVAQHERALSTTAHEIMCVLGADFTTICRFDTPKGRKAAKIPNRFVTINPDSLSMAETSDAEGDSDKDSTVYPTCNVLAISIRNPQGDAEADLEMARIAGNSFNDKKQRRRRRRQKRRGVTPQEMEEYERRKGLLGRNYTLLGDPDELLREARTALVHLKRPSRLSSKSQSESDSALPSETESGSDGEFELLVLQTATEKIGSLLPPDLKGDKQRGERGITAAILMGHRVWGVITCMRLPRQIINQFDLRAMRMGAALGQKHVKGGWREADKAVLIQLSGQLGLGITQVDFTEEQRKQSRLLEAAHSESKAKSMIMANTSHELRTPLNAIIGMMELLQDTTLSPEQLEMIQTVSNSSELLLGIVNDILDFSRLEADKVKFHFSDFSIQDLIESTMDMFSEVAGGKGIELVNIVNLPDAFPQRVRADSARLQQVLINLINNAIKFTTTGEVVVRVTCEGSLTEMIKRQEMQVEAANLSMYSSFSSSSGEDDDDEENTDNDIGGEKDMHNKARHKTREMRARPRGRKRGHRPQRRKRGKGGVTFYRTPGDYANEGEVPKRIEETKKEVAIPADMLEALKNATEGDKDNIFYIRVDVRDTGIGMTQEGLDRIFRSFSQIDDSMSRTYGGTGLGLAISKHLVQLAGGEIGARSRPGRGSCFWFTWACMPASTSTGEENVPQRSAPLPVWSMPSQPVSKTSPTLEDMPSRTAMTAVANQRALVVGHSESALTSICLHLRGIVEYHAVRNLPEAMAMFKMAAEGGNPFIIVLLDISSLTEQMLDNVSAGWEELAAEAVSQFRKVYPVVHVTFMVPSDSAHRSAVWRVLEKMEKCPRIYDTSLTASACCGYLTKPIKRTKLLRCVRAAIAVSAAPVFAASLTPPPSMHPKAPLLLPLVSVEKRVKPAKAKERKLFDERLNYKESSPSSTSPGSPSTANSPLTALMTSIGSNARGRRRVLVVEDNKVNQKLVLAQLAKLGYEADTAINGLEAVNMVRDNDYALVLMDVSMPVMDGFEATEQIRRAKGDKYVSLPIIALTASVMDGDHARCIRVGMNDFLAKPLRATLLAAAMKKWYPEQGEEQP